MTQQAIAKPGFDIGDEPLFGCCTDEVTKITDINLFWKSSIQFKPPPYHLDTQFVHELKVLHDTGHDCLLNLRALRIELRPIIHDTQYSIERLNCSSQ